MQYQYRTILAALLLATVACNSSEPAAPTAPTPLTKDEQIVADCHDIQAALEAYADAHGGEYPSQSQDVNAFETSVKRLNRYTGFITEPRLDGAVWPGQIGVRLYYETASPGHALGYRITGQGAHGTLLVLEDIDASSPADVDAYNALADEIDVVMTALNAFADEAGYFPMDMNDQSPLGKSLSDFLPEGKLLENPFYPGYLMNPTDGLGLAATGQLGYLGSDLGRGACDSYVLEAYGAAAGEVFIMRRPFSEEDLSTRYHMFGLQQAINEFSSQSGRFPQDVNVDETPGGETVLDLLPSMTNVYTGAAMTPRNGLASLPGEVGYQPAVENDTVVGYVINGFGIVDEFHRITVSP